LRNYYREITVTPDDSLKLSNQLCFPLYALARQIIKAYTPHLNKLGLTYTQYIVMMVMWEYKTISIKDLCEMLYLDSGTITPVIKKLVSEKLITKERSIEDQRLVFVHITDKGQDLKENAYDVPKKMVCKVNLNDDELKQMYTLTYKILAQITKNDN